jgi:hypothetical protein
VIRTGGVRMAEFYGKTMTAKQLADQEKVPRSIYEDFVHNQKCGSCGEEPCRENKRNKNNNSPIINGNSTGGSNDKQEEKPKKYNQSQNGNSNLANFFGKNGNYTGLIASGIVLILLSTAATILILKKKRTTHKK